MDNVIIAHVTAKGTKVIKAATVEAPAKAKAKITKPARQIDTTPKAAKVKADAKPLDPVADFIAKGGKVTKLPTAKASAKEAKPEKEIVVKAVAPKPVKAKPIKADKGFVPVPLADAKPKAAKPSKAVSEVLDPGARKATRVTASMLKLLGHDAAIATISKNIMRYREHAEALREQFGYEPFSLLAARKRTYVNPYVDCYSAYLGDKAVMERLLGAGKLKLVEATDSDCTLQLTQVRL